MFPAAIIDYMLLAICTSLVLRCRFTTIITPTFHLSILPSLPDLFSTNFHPIIAAPHERSFSCRFKLRTDLGHGFFPIFERPQEVRLSVLSSPSLAILHSGHINNDGIIRDVRPRKAQDAVMPVFCPACGIRANIGRQHRSHARYFWAFDEKLQNCAGE